MNTEVIRPFENPWSEWFPLKNAVIDNIMPSLSGSGWKILCVALRETWGWSSETNPKDRRERATISYSRFRNCTGIKSDSTIQRALSECLDGGYLLRQPSSLDPQGFSYELNTQYELATSTETVEPSTETVEVTSTETVDNKIKGKKVEKESPSDKAGEELLEEFFGSRPAKKSTETDLLADLSSDEKNLALASGLAACEHERRGSRIAMTPQEEGDKLLLRFCAIHSVPIPKNKRVRARQANVFVRCKRSADAGYQACEKALVALKENYSFRSYNSADDKGFQRDFTAEAYRSAHVASRHQAPEVYVVRSRNLFTGEIEEHGEEVQNVDP